MWFNTMETAANRQIGMRNTRTSKLLQTRLIAVLAGLLITLVVMQIASAATCRIDLGSPAPALSGEDVAGNFRSIDEFRGKWVFIDFWATWCKPCMHKLPGVVDLYQQTSGRGDFEVMSVSLDYDNTLKQVHSVTEDYGIKFPVLFDGRGWQNENVSGWCVEAIPATFLVDPQGRVVARDISPDSVLSLIDSSGYATPQNSPVIEIRTTEHLSRAASVSGMRDCQDFQVDIDILESSQNVDFYRLNMAYAYYNESRILVESRSRYDIRIHRKEAVNGFPYDLEIYRQRVDPNEDIWLNYEPYIGTPVQDTGQEGSLMAQVDLERRSYRFILPIPRDCVMVAYNVDLFDRALNDYLSNGVRRMESAY